MINQFIKTLINQYINRQINHPSSQLINQPINQSTSQPNCSSINYPIHQKNNYYSINQEVKVSINLRTSKLLNVEILQPIRFTCLQKTNLLKNNVKWWMSKPNKQKTEQSINRTKSHSINYWTKCSINQSINQ